jgi:hypothetical protein
MTRDGRSGHILAMLPFDSADITRLRGRGPRRKTACTRWLTGKTIHGHASAPYRDAFRYRGLAHKVPAHWQGVNKT